jgi:tetratricopeptide (TPR) repeat protein
MRAWARSRGNAGEGAKIAALEIKRYPDSALLNLVIGKDLNTQKNFKESKKYFEKALTLAGKQNLSPEVVFELEYGMAVSCLYTDDLKKANQYADKALIAQPNSATLHLVKGEYFLSEDQPQAAFAELQKAHKLDRCNPDILVPLARAATGCGKSPYQELGLDAAKLAARVSNDKKLELLKSYCALECGQLQEAMTYMALYRAECPPTAEMYYVLHGILKKLNEKEKSEKALAIALQADPNIKKKIRLYLNRDVVPFKATRKDGKAIPRN